MMVQQQKSNDVYIPQSHIHLYGIFKMGGRTMSALRIILVLFSLLSIGATQASMMKYDRVNYSNANHEELAEDMRVKVLGGYATVTRLYKQVRQTTAQANDSNTYVGVSGAIGGYAGTNNERESIFVGAGDSRPGGSLVSTVRKNDFGVWIFNPEWHDLVFLDRDLNRVNAGGSSSVPIFNVDRNDFIYKRKNNGEYYEYQHNGANLRITPTPTGYQWTNRKGDYINYNALGRATGYGDKNAVTVTFERNADGLIENIRDHLNRVVLTWTYNGKRPIRVEDYTGRRVLYEWNGNTLTKVTTVRGHDWRYEYDTISGNRVMVAKIDPEGQRFEYRYQMSRAGFQSTRGSSAPSRPIIGDDGIIVRGSRSSGGGSFASIGVSIAAPSMLMHTEKVYPDGKRDRYQYFYDHDSEIYVLITQNSDGFEHERWFDLDGEIKQELKGGLLARKRVRDGRRAVATDAYGNKTVTTYTRWEAIESVTFADGTKNEFEYLPNLNFPTLSADELGVKTKIDYDSKGNPVQISLGLGTTEERVTEFEYDEFGQVLLQRILGDDQTATVEISHTYDDYGNRTGTTNGNGNRIVYRELNAIGQAEEMVDGRGNVWKSTYDAAGNLTTQTTPLEFETAFEYDSLHRALKMIDAEQRQTAYEYDSRDNLTRITNNQDGVTETTYRMDGQVLTTKDESSQLITARYDRAARLLSSSDGTGNITHFRYERGDELAGMRIQNIILPNNQIFYTYDKRNRQTRQRFASLDNELADVTDIGYSARGEKVSVVDGIGNETSYRYNAHRELISETNAEEETVVSTYDRRANIISIEDAKGKATQYRYDSNSNKVLEIRPMGESFNHQFDANDNLVLSTDAVGNIASYQYDKDNRLVGNSNSIPFTDEAERSVVYTYDATNLLLSHADNVSSTSYNYDGLARLITQTTNFENFSKTLSKTYYANNQVASRTDSEDVSYNYTYDTSGKMLQMAIENEGSISINQYSGYLPTSLTFPGGTKQILQYDGLSRVQSILVSDPSDAVLLSQQYSRDVVGNILSKTTLQGMYSFEYDQVNRVTEATQPNILGNQSFRYDDNGNRINQSVDGVQLGLLYNDNHELTRINKGSSTTDYEYDENGALLLQQSDTQTVRYQYNSFARLASVEVGVTEPVRYQYDPVGRRVSKTVGTQTTYFLYDGPNLVAEYSQDGVLIRGYVYRPDSSEASTPIVSKIPSGNDSVEYRYHQNDYLGTPQQLLKKNGVVAWQGNYDVFGSTSENDVNNPIRFPGQYFDQETGLHYNWNRYYSNQTGRYISSDPLGLVDGPNPYSYAYSNPLKYTDSTGEYVHLLIGFGLGVAFEYFTNPCASAGDLLLAGGLGALGGGLSKAAFLRHGPRSLTRVHGKEWSHSIPNRIVNRFTRGPLNRALNRRGGLNGSWASPTRHYRHDPSRFPRGWRGFGERFSPPVRALDRIPDWLKGTGAAAGIGAGIAGSDCECN